VKNKHCPKALLLAFHSIMNLLLRIFRKNIIINYLKFQLLSSNAPHIKPNIFWCDDVLVSHYSGKCATLTSMIMIFFLYLQYFTDVIARPIVRAARSTNRELEVSAEDEQQFLLKQQQYLQNTGQPAQGGGGSPAANGPASQKTSQDPRNSPRVESPKKVTIFCLLGFGCLIICSGFFHQVFLKTCNTCKVSV
jgi:hypothetical protein